VCFFANGASELTAAAAADEETVVDAVEAAPGVEARLSRGTHRDRHAFVDVCDVNIQTDQSEQIIQRNYSNHRNC
jgi:hypothetical protein